MGSFIVRVELHGANWEDYEVLHEAMEMAGFSRTIRGDSGADFHLPTAEYCLIGNFTIDQVRGRAVSATGQTGRSFSVLATESNSSAWYNLAPRGTAPKG